MRSHPILTGLLAVTLVIGYPSVGWSDENSPPEASCKFLNCKVSASEPGAPGGGDSPPRKTGGSGSGSGTERSLKKFNAAWDTYVKELDNYEACTRASVSGTGPAVACMAPLAPSTTEVGSFNRPGGPPPITPAQAGAIAAARLKIPTVAPGIGPSPDLNRWKMAAVGYPLWLWADGPTQVGPVSDSVAGLSVSLRAEVTSLTFRMGDGKVVTCQGVGDKWTKAVEPGTKAPSCGHTYTRPSLPKGNYKVAALTEWAVTWTANGQSGVIDVPAVQTTELPVGELQVLVR